jgi:hypothetical protein
VLCFKWDTGTRVVIELSIRNKQSFFRVSIPPVMRQEASQVRQILTHPGSRLGIPGHFLHRLNAARDCFTSSLEDLGGPPHDLSQNLNLLRI